MNFLELGRARAVNAAAMLMKRGAQLPLTLLARLDALGVDLAVLEAAYA